MSSERVECASPRDWLRKIVSHGGKYVRDDDPFRKKLGMRDTTTGVTFLLARFRLSEHAKEVPQPIRNLLGTAEGRDKLAWVLTTGDHCLEFPGDDGA